MSDKHSDIVEAERTPSTGGPTVVGIGASAGGLTALKGFFARVPPDNPLAFVVVVHLTPGRESHLADLLRAEAALPVEQVNATISIEAGHIYVIPPGCNLSTIDTHLRLSELEERRAQRAPIDHFFTTLAATHDGHAVGVVLTGTGSDGTLGIKAIKENGGLTIAQDPREADYGGMPQSVIATGQIDLVLPLLEIPDTIAQYERVHPRLPAVRPSPQRDGDRDEWQVIQRIFLLLRSATGRDFSRYKSSTILRRIGRRMQLSGVEALND